jgi:ABC-type polysaccharide/polyol phosphate transport system ATPase subunit
VIVLALLVKMVQENQLYLKILSKITPPTSGKIISRGRIASLLEVGTGFHPELSGRENVFMNGSILGMRKAEIIKNFDAIVDFAGDRTFHRYTPKTLQQRHAITFSICCSCVS